MVTSLHYPAVCVGLDSSCPELKVRERKHTAMRALLDLVGILGLRIVRNEELKEM